MEEVLKTSEAGRLSVLFLLQVHVLEVGMCAQGSYSC